MFGQIPSMMISWATVTSLGDITVTAPVATLIMGGFVMTRAWRLAWWWASLFIGGLILVLATKIAFIGWGIGIQSLDFTGISGHSMRATAIAPVLCYLIFQNAPARARLLGVFLGLMLGMVIGISRVALHTHSLSEATSGYLLGAAISLGFVRILSRSPTIEIKHSLIVFCLLALLLAPFTEPVPTLSMIVDIALRLSGHDHPFVRE